MPFSLIPDQVFARYTDLTPQVLKDFGVELLLCDLDYTLAPRSMAEPDGTLHTWLEECREAGYALQEEGRWHLTPQGFLVSNQIISGMLEVLAAEKRRRADAAARRDYRVNLD